MSSIVRNFGSDFLATWDKNDSAIRQVLDLAQRLGDRFYGSKPTKKKKTGGGGDLS